MKLDSDSKKLALLKPSKKMLRNIRKIIITSIKYPTFPMIVAMNESTLLRLSVLYRYTLNAATLIIPVKPISKRMISIKPIGGSRLNTKTKARMKTFKDRRPPICPVAWLNVIGFFLIKQTTRNATRIGLRLAITRINNTLIKSINCTVI